ncbi:MAG: DUF2156 domain-containing protein [Spirochaetaceae bacterium]|nr:DUF2156 domain-containing protein [Spirochaetaceae bacterium]
MNQSKLSLKDRNIITEKLDAIGMHLSEFSFPNLYLFRNTHQYETITTPHGFFLSGITYDKKRFLMPMTNPKKAGEDCFNELKGLLKEEKWDFVFPVPEEWLSCFDEKDFTRTFNPEDSDYLYLTEKFKTYPGKKLHKKKNRLNQFIKNYEPLLIPLTDDVIEDAKGVLELWQEFSSQEMITSDYSQCMEALEMHSELKLTGAMAFADGKPAGFLIGEELNNDTFTIHFAKADIRFNGIYQFLFSRFTSDFCPNYEFLNLEQDMGSEGLRKNKESYRPNFMAHKYRISLKNN